MLDVRQIFVKPSSKPGYLKGTFSLYCAYMRGDVVEEDSASEPDVAKDPAAVRESAMPKAVVPAELKSGSMDAPVAPGTEPEVPVKAAAEPVPQEKEKILRTEIKGADVKDAQADVEEAAVKAALEILKKMQNRP